MSENWKFFKQKFQIYLTASKANSEQNLYQFALFFSIVGDRALKINNNFVFDNDEDKDNLTVVLKKFNDYFMPDKNVTYERHKFFLREQKPGEKVDSYVTELRDLSSTCDFGDLTDSLIKDRIILGIKDLSIKDRLLRTKDLMLSKALEICRTAQITKSQLEGICSNSHSSVLDVDRVRMDQKNSHLPARPKTHFHSSVRKPNLYGTNSTSILSGSNNFNKNASFYKDRNQKVKSVCFRCGFKHKTDQCPAKG